MIPNAPRTPLEALVGELRACAASPGGVAPPAAILWTDPDRTWSSLLPVLLPELPELIVLGEYEPARRTGPAIWLRCVIDGTLVEPALPPDRAPVVLLPGVSRQDLRAGEQCPEPLRPLVELMFRGTSWLQRGGRDWSARSFFGAAPGLGLDLAGDDATGEALRRALPEVMVTPLAQLRGRRLEAEDFDRLLASDVVRDLLRFLGDPEATRARLGANGWGAFASQCRERLAFDPETDADVTAGERLGRGEGPWKEVWERYAESPASYPGVEDLLRRSRPSGELPFERHAWPDLNAQDEEAVREALRRLEELAHDEACERVVALDEEHAARREGAWARLGSAPMAAVLEPLRRLAEAARRPVMGTSVGEAAAIYEARGWQGDAASWEAVALAPTADEVLVGRAVRHLLLPWLDASARAFQVLLERTALPSPVEQGAVEAGEDGCVLFSDGLRLDLGRRLAERLEGRGLRVTLRTRWSALPSVTATAKPGVTPVVDLVRGDELGEDFGVRLAPDGRPADARNLRAAMTERGYQVLGPGDREPPRGARARAWAEAGDVDALGHQLGGRLARQVPEELERLCEAACDLLEAGWQRVRIVTDHGWLLVPGGLPRVDLPRHLTESRWARCAVLAGDSRADVARHPWTWNEVQSFAFAPGASCFNKTEEYAHGGLSLQECLTPDLLVERAASREVLASIESVTWRGLRCFVEARAPRALVRADLRLGGPGGVSVVATTKPLEDDGSVSLVLAGDDHEDDDLSLVLLDESGRVLCQRPTRAGERS